MSQGPSKSRIGRLLFFVVCGKPDIIEAVGAINKHMANSEKFIGCYEVGHLLLEWYL